MRPPAEALHDLSLAEAADRLARREVTSRALTEAVLARIRAVEPTVHAFLEVTAVSMADQGMTRMVLILPEWAPAQNGGGP